MKLIKPKYPLYLKKSKERGWGVFCAKPIKKGTIFERAPIIFLPAKVWNRTSDTPIESYRFSFWGDACAIVLGYGSLYNHSHDDANCTYDVDRPSRTFAFSATQDIPAHTEILHDYNWDESEYTKRGMKSEKKAAEAKAKKLAQKKLAQKKRKQAEEKRKRAAKKSKRGAAKAKPKARAAAKGRKPRRRS